MAWAFHVANYGGGTVTRYDSTGKLVGTLLGLVNPIFLTVDGLSEIWVVDHTINTLSAWDFFGKQLYSITASGYPSVYYGIAKNNRSKSVCTLFQRKRLNN